MGLRSYAFLLVCALLGAAVAVLPAVAGSETAPTIEAVNSGLYYHYWVPPTRTVAPGGTVAFSNPTTVAHGVEWRSTIKPSCSAGVPVGTSPAASGTNWSGTCTFAQPGSYSFYCTVHGASMSGTVTVSSSGETTVSTTTAPPPTVTTPPPGTSTPGTPTATSPSPGPPRAGAPPLISLAGSQRGRAVRGAVQVSGADAGGRLEVDLLAGRASLAGAGALAQARVGRLVRSSVRAGKQPFSVALDARARAALRRHHRLALTVRVILTPAQGPPASLSRRVVLHP